MDITDSLPPTPPDGAPVGHVMIAGFPQEVTVRHLPSRLYIYLDTTQTRGIQDEL